MRMTVAVTAVLLAFVVAAVAQADDGSATERVPTAWRALEAAARTRDWAKFRSHCTARTAALIEDLEREAAAPWSPNADALDKLAVSVGAKAARTGGETALGTVEVRSPDVAAVRLTAGKQSYVVVFHREGGQWKFDLDDTLSL